LESVGKDAFITGEGRLSSKMPTLVLTNFNIVTAALGGFITVFALVSYLLKERFYFSEARKSLATIVTIHKY
jgi:hypothetical protein